MQIFEILHAEVYILVSLFCLSNIGAAVFFIGERLPLTIDASGGKCVLILVAKISTYGKCVQVMVTNITRLYHTWVTKQHCSCNIQNTKNPKYVFVGNCAKKLCQFCPNFLKVFF